MLHSVDNKKSNDNFTFTYAAEFSTHPLYTNTLWTQVKVKAISHNQNEPAKTIIFVIDKSGSMRGPRITMVKNALKKFLDHGLSEKDIFHVISFDSEGKIELANIKKSSLHEKILSHGNMLTPMEIIERIEPDKGGTNMENGLALIGKPSFGAEMEFVPVQDVNNTFIILLSDGVNRSENFEKLAKLGLEKRCGGEPCLIPIGISNESSFESLEKLSSIQEQIYIRAYGKWQNTPKDYDADKEVNNAFEIAASKLSQRTRQIQLIFSIDGNSYTAQMGSLSHNQELYYVETVDNKKNEITVKVNSNIPDGGLTLFKNMHEIGVNRDVLAAYVLQRVTSINKIIANAKSYQECHVNELVNMLPLISPPEVTDSMFVEQVRHNLFNTLNAYKKMDQEELRATIAVGTMIAAGARTEFANNMVQTMESKVSHIEELKIKDKTHIPVSQTIDYVEYVNGRTPLVSIDPALSLRSALVINPEKIKQLPQYAAMKKGFGSGSIRLTHSLQLVVSQLEKLFTGDQIDKISAAYGDVKVTSKIVMSCAALEDFMEQGQGICRHIAPLTAIFIADLVTEKKLEAGSVRQFRGTSIDGNLAHTWVIYSPKNKKSGPFLIDMTNSKIGIKPVYNLSDIGQRHLACQDYAARGLPGVLDACLSLQFKDHLPAVIEDNLLNDVKDEEEFKIKGLVCPISNMVPQDPVYIHGQPETHIFDRAYIHEWLKRKKVNPLTNQACSEILVPAVKARDEIVLTIGRQKASIPPEELTKAAIIKLKPVIDRRQDVLQKVEAKIKTFGTIIPLAYDNCNRSGIRESIGAAASEQIRKLRNITKPSNDDSIPAVLLSDNVLEYYFKSRQDAECLSHYFSTLGMTSHFFCDFHEHKLHANVPACIKDHGPFAAKLSVTHAPEIKKNIEQVFPFDHSFTRGLYLVSGSGFSYYKQENIFDSLKAKLQTYHDATKPCIESTRSMAFNIPDDEMRCCFIASCFIKDIQNSLDKGNLVNGALFLTNDKYLPLMDKVIEKAKLNNQEIKCMEYILNQGQVPAYRLGQKKEGQDKKPPKKKM